MGRDRIHHALIDGVEKKRCSRCGWQALDKFNKNRATLDGLCCWCRDCKGRPVYARYIRDRAEAAGIAVFKCVRCKTPKPRKDFIPDPQYTNGLSRECRPCRVEVKRIARRRARE